jgi:hypothetical protein
MKQASRIVSRGVAAVSLAALMTIAAGLAPQARADTGGADNGVVGTDITAPTAAPTTRIVQPGAGAPTYSPNYLSTCVHTASPAFVIANTTATTQTVTTLPSEKPAPGGRIGPGKSVGFTVTGTFPGFVVVGLAANHKTALLVYCS